MTSDGNSGHETFLILERVRHRTTVHMRQGINKSCLSPLPVVEGFDAFSDGPGWLLYRLVVTAMNKLILERASEAN